MEKEGKMNQCKKCGQPLGSNKDCEECLRYLIEQGREEVSEDDAIEAVQKYEDWRDQRGKSAPEKLLHQVEILVRMIKDYISGAYREIPWKTIAAVVFAIIYVINPFDLVPDFIPGIGWLDDAAIVTLVVAAIKAELDKYQNWLEKK